MKLGASIFSRNVRGRPADRHDRGAIRQAERRQSEAVAHDWLRGFATLSPRERQVMEGHDCRTFQQIDSRDYDISPRPSRFTAANVNDQMQANACRKLVRLAMRAACSG